MKRLAALLLVGAFVFCAVPVQAELKDEIKEQTKELEARISELEDSVSSINSKITEYYESIETDLEENVDENEAS